MWATAASVSEKYMQYEDVLYERARKYVEVAEMKVRGEIEVEMFTC
jgi:translation initiation factor 2 alpha subunit (eIF-2alpha)